MRNPVRLAVIAATLACAEPTLAQSGPPFVGKWGVEGPDACKYGVGTDDLKTTFTAKQLEYYGSACRVTSSRRLSKSGDSVHRLKLRCEGEGEKFDNEVILAVLEKTEHRPDLLVHIDTRDWAMITYQRCAE